MSENLFSRLKSDMPYMSGVERKITETILDNPQKFITYTLPGLAHETDVSQGSIINFSKKFAGGGFPALKLRIAGAMRDFMPESYTIIEENDTITDALRKTTENSRNALKYTTEINKESSLRKITDKILSAKKIEIYGVYRSAAVATDFCYQLLQIGVPATFVSDILTCSVSASMLDSDCVVIAVSSSGETKDIIDPVKIAKEKGAYAIALTGNGYSPLAKLSDEVLIAASSGNSLSEKSSEIRLSQLALTDAICSYIGSRIDENGEKRYIEMREILNSHSIAD